MRAAAPWRQALKADPLPWLLEKEDPAVRHLALRWLLDEPENSPAAQRARAAAMRADPIAATLAAQHPEGYWVRPGSGYGPKYTGTVWSLMFLDQLGADARHRGIQRACAYVLEHTQAPGGGFGWNGRNSGAVHCLHGNLIGALIGFGVARRRTRAVRGRMAGEIDHGRGVRFLVPLGHERAWLLVRDQRGAAVRVGRDQGAPRSGADPAAPKDATRASCDRQRSGVPAR